MKNFIMFLVLMVNLALIFFGLKNLVSAEQFASRIGLLQNEVKQSGEALSAEKLKFDELQKKFTEVENVKTMVQKELKEKKDEAADLAKQLSKEKQLRVELQRKLEKAEKQVTFLETQVKQEKEKSQQLEERLQRMADRLEKQESDKQTLAERLNSSLKEREELKSKLTKIEEQDKPRLTLAEITVSEKKQFSGLVFNVNEKFNFCIVSIGKNDGIIPGIELIVYRGGKLIGKVVIEKVFERMSSAKILSTQPDEMIQVEDRVRKID